jgi:hypothetical protein
MPEAFQGSTTGEKGGRMTLDGYIKFFKTHEKAFIIAAVLLFAWHLYGSGLNAWVDHEKRQDAVALEVAKDSAAKNAEVQQQLSDLQKQIAATNAHLDSVMAQRAADNQKQKDADTKLAGEQLAARLRALLPVNVGDVTWSPVQGNLVFTENAGHVVASVADDRNKLQADVQDLQQKLSGDQTVLVKQTDAIVSANLALADEKKAHAADVNLLNAEMHTKWRNGFKWGVIAGTVGTVVVEKVFHIKL